MAEQVQKLLQIIIAIHALFNEVYSQPNKLSSAVIRAYNHVAQEIVAK